jgi:hypothetical protein
MLIKEAWDVVNEAGNTNQLSQKTAALKLISDVQQIGRNRMQKLSVYPQIVKQTQSDVLNIERKPDVEDAYLFIVTEYNHNT